MTPLQIEAKALRTLEAVTSGQPHEDMLIELKAEWPDDARKAARQIAGHANAARGQPILWLIGADQTRGFIGAEFQELANWWPKVQKNFDGQAPSMRDRNVLHDGKTLVALLFETDRAPFVVINPAANMTAKCRGAKEPRRGQHIVTN